MKSMIKVEDLNLLKHNVYSMIASHDFEIEKKSLMID